MKEYIEKCLAGSDLTADEAAGALDRIMTGQATDVQIAGLIIALRAKGESVDEILGFARTMRAHAIRIVVEDPDAIDMCGTGGTEGGHSTSLQSLLLLQREQALLSQNTETGQSPAGAGARTFSPHSGSISRFLPVGCRNASIGSV